MPRDLFIQPLFSPKLIAKTFSAQPIPLEHLQTIADWLQALKGEMGKKSEEQVRPVFLQRFFIEMLGYTPLGQGAYWTLEHEGRAASGAADALLGSFADGQRKTVAPFELKGPKTIHLDALMSGRHKSPVQQAWEYAMDLPGSQFVLVSNCVEVRLYAVGYGRAVYESWTIADLQEPARYASFIGLLAADALIDGKTQQLLKASQESERDITQALYQDYKNLRRDLIIGLHNLNPKEEFAALVRHAQKLIDRLLFIAFAESRDLIPPGSIAHAAKHIDPYNPQPRWNNFVALFKAVDSGNPYLKIPPYNGGLFAPDAALDALKVSDKLVARFTQLSGYDYAGEVSVTVLGRIFEQSISDLEEIAQAGDIEKFKLANTVQAAAKNVQGKRKRDGVVYTPDHITRFIVEKSLRPLLLERFLALRVSYESESAWRKPSKAETADCPKSVETHHITEYAFWLSWGKELTHIRVCDPACGSGAFLVAAFDVFKEAYTQLHLKLRELAPEELLQTDISHEILKNNLFGVDINPESIEITKLSLWLKTAEKDHQLAGLEANFYQGNSLIEDAKIDPLAFDWQKTFAPFLVAAPARSTGEKPLNGIEKQSNLPIFDLILGNPPYVRQELFSLLKPALQTRYGAYHGVADLFVYFFELALNLLKPGGRLGYISSSSYFKSSSGEPLRRLLLQSAQIETLVDFGDWQVFEGVTTYPAVLIAKKPDWADKTNQALFLQLKAAVPDLLAHFEDYAQSLDLAQLGDGSKEWQLEGRQAAALRAKLLSGHKSLKEALGSPYRGVLTGLNEAFIISRAKRDELLQADPTAQALFKPFLKGDDIERWRVESQDLWLIFTQRGTDIDRYPAVKAHLEQFREQLEPRPESWLPTSTQREWPGRKPGKYQWFEIQDTIAYAEKFECPKIFYPDICNKPSFAVDLNGFFSANTVYFLPSDQAWAAALLNSKALWFLIAGMSTHIRGGYRRMFTQQIETLPIPATSKAVQTELSALAESAQAAAAARLKLQRDFAKRIGDLCPNPPPKGANPALSEALKSWWLLPDFAAFSTEVSKRFKTDIPLRERNDWQQWFEEQKAAVQSKTNEITALEISINSLVYELFDLSKAEIALIERETA